MTRRRHSNKTKKSGKSGGKAKYESEEQKRGQESEKEAIEKEKEEGETADTSDHHAATKHGQDKPLENETEPEKEVYLNRYSTNSTMQTDATDSNENNELEIDAEMNEQIEEVVAKVSGAQDTSITNSVLQDLLNEESGDEAVHPAKQAIQTDLIKHEDADNKVIDADNKVNEFEEMHKKDQGEEVPNDGKVDTNLKLHDKKITDDVINSQEKKQEQQEKEVYLNRYSANSTMQTDATDSNENNELEIDAEMNEQIDAVVAKVSGAKDTSITNSVLQDLLNEESADEAVPPAKQAIQTDLIKHEDADNKVIDADNKVNEFEEMHKKYQGEEVPNDGKLDTNLKLHDKKITDDVINSQEKKQEQQEKEVYLNRYSANSTMQTDATDSNENNELEIDAEMNEQIDAVVAKVSGAKDTSITNSVLQDLLNEESADEAVPPAKQAIQTDLIKHEDADNKVIDADNKVNEFEEMHKKYQGEEVPNDGKVDTNLKLHDKKITDDVINSQEKKQEQQAVAAVESTVEHSKDSSMAIINNVDCKADKEEDEETKLKRQPNQAMLKAIEPDPQVDLDYETIPKIFSIALPQGFEKDQCLQKSLRDQNIEYMRDLFRPLVIEALQNIIPSCLQNAKELEKAPSQIVVDESSNNKDMNDQLRNKQDLNDQPLYEKESKREEVDESNSIREPNDQLQKKKELNDQTQKEKDSNVRLEPKEIIPIRYEKEVYLNRYSTNSTMQTDATDSNENNELEIDAEMNEQIEEVVAKVSGAQDTSITNSVLQDLLNEESGDEAVHPAKQAIQTDLIKHEDADNKVIDADNKVNEFEEMHNKDQGEEVPNDGKVDTNLKLHDKKITDDVINSQEKKQEQQEKEVYLNRYSANSTMQTDATDSNENNELEIDAEMNEQINAVVAKVSGAKDTSITNSVLQDLLNEESADEAVPPAKQAIQTDLIKHEDADNKVIDADNKVNEFEEMHKKDQGEEVPNDGKVDTNLKLHDKKITDDVINSQEKKQEQQPTKQAVQIDLIKHEDADNKVIDADNKVNEFEEMHNKDQGEEVPEDGKVDTNLIFHDKKTTDDVIKSQEKKQEQQAVAAVESTVEHSKDSSMAIINNVDCKADKEEDEETKLKRQPNQAMLKAIEPEPQVDLDYETIPKIFSIALPQGFEKDQCLQKSLRDQNIEYMRDLFRPLVIEALQNIIPSCLQNAKELEKAPSQIVVDESSNNKDMNDQLQNKQDLNDQPLYEKESKKEEVYESNSIREPNDQLQKKKELNDHTQKDKDSNVRLEPKEIIPIRYDTPKFESTRIEIPDKDEDDVILPTDLTDIRTEQVVEQQNGDQQFRDEEEFKKEVKIKDHVLKSNDSIVKTNGSLDHVTTFGTTDKAEIKPSQEPLKFHKVHGDNIILSRNKFRAKRKQKSNFFSKGIAFSSRPVAVGEKVSLHLKQVSRYWLGYITIGFTTNDPMSIADNLPTNVIERDCTDGFWAEHLNKKYYQESCRLHYYLNSSGNMCFGVNGVDKIEFLWNLETSKPVWALIDVFGYFTIVEFDIPKELRNKSFVESSFLSDKNETGDSFNYSLDDSEVNKPCLNYQIRFVPLDLYTQVEPSCIKFLEDRGVCVTSGDKGGCIDGKFPLFPGQTIVVQNLSVGMALFYIGVKYGSPTTEASCNLPEPVETKVEMHLKDEVAITFTEAGEIRVTKNLDVPKTILKVNRSQELWPFVKISKRNQMIKVWTSSTPSLAAFQT